MEFLPYVGSKRIHVERILAMIPPDAKVCSPFTGSGHVEHALAERGNTVFAYDAWFELVTLWGCMRDPAHREDVATQLPTLLPRERDEFYVLREGLQRNGANMTCCTRAASFLALNRTSFNNNSRTFGKRMLARMLTQLMGVQAKIRSFTTKLNVQLMRFEQSLPLHPDCIWFLDAPYLVKWPQHYGYGGCLHKEFDHDALARLVRAHAGGFILTYNDCERVRELYAGYTFIPLKEQKRYRDHWRDGVQHVLITNMQVPASAV